MSVEEERCTALGGKIRYMDMDCNGALVVSMHVWQERDDSEFTVGRVHESLVQPRERMTTGIVGYRCAGKENGRSRVERKGAYDREKRQPADQGSLALADAISRHF